MVRKIEFVEDRSDWQTGPCDVFICALGYETRSRYIAEMLASRAATKLALVFNTSEAFDYTLNERRLRELGFTEVSFSNRLAMSLEEAIQKIEREDLRSVVRIVIDVSSMSRPMIASCIWFIAASELRKDIICEIVYAPAIYSDDIRQFGPIAFSGPVIPELAG